MDKKSIQDHVNALLDKGMAEGDPRLHALVDDATMGMHGLLLSLDDNPTNAKYLFDMMLWKAQKESEEKGNLLQALRLQILGDASLPRVNKEEFARRIDVLYCDWTEAGLNRDKTDEYIPGGRATFLGNANMTFIQCLDFYDTLKEKGLTVAMKEHGDIIEEVIKHGQGN